MSLSNKLDCLRDFYNRPVVLTGLYFFLVSMLPVYSQENSSIRLIEPLLEYEPYTLADFPDSSQVFCKTTWAPLYDEKDRASGGDSQHVTINARSISSGIFSRGERLTYYLSCRHDAMEASFRQREENYLFTGRRDEWNIASGAAYRHQNLLVGIGLGRVLQACMKKEPLSEIRDHPESYLLRGPWQLSFEVQADFPIVAGRLSLFSGPVHSSVTKLSTGDEVSFRTFPLSIIRRSAAAGIDIHTGSYSSSSIFGIDYFENADLQTTSNLMPQDVAIRNYRLEHCGSVRLPFTDSLGWNVSGALAGGWVASYNFERDRLTFFKADSVQFYHTRADVGAKLPCAITAGICRTYLQGISPSGFLKLSALSTWSAFKSLDYRYTHAELTFRETGGFINRKFTFSCVDILPQLYASYIAAQMGLSTSQREIVVLLPVYSDTIAQEVFNTRLMLFEPSLAALAHFGSIQVTGSVHQALPIVIPSKKNSGKTGLPATTKARDNIVTGGTRLYLSAMWRIPHYRKIKQ